LLGEGALVVWFAWRGTAGKMRRLDTPENEVRLVALVAEALQKPEPRPTKPPAREDDSEK